jgi:hypothetical protein
MKNIKPALLAIISLLFIQSAFAISFWEDYQPRGRAITPVSRAYNALKPYLSHPSSVETHEKFYTIHDWRPNFGNLLAAQKVAERAFKTRELPDVRVVEVERRYGKVAYALALAIRNLNVARGPGQMKVEELTTKILDSQNTSLFSVEFSGHFSAGSAIILFDRLEKEIFIIGSSYNE